MLALGSQVAFLLDLAAEFGHRGERGRLWLAEQADETPVERPDARPGKRID